MKWQAIESLKHLLVLRFIYVDIILLLIKENEETSDVL